MKNNKVRYHDDAIRQMLKAKLKSRFIRKLHISPKLIARINKGLPANNPGAPAKFKDYHKKFFIDLVLANPLKYDHLLNHYIILQYQQELSQLYSKQIKYFMWL